MINKRTEGSYDYIFQKIAAGKPEDLNLTVGSRKHAAREWFRNTASQIRQVNVPNLFRKADKDRVLIGLSPNNIGQMFTFKYNAKLANKLPYWDMYPLIFPIELYSDGFLGINLHYLPPSYRARFMDALYTISNNNRYDNTTRIMLSYQVLKAAKKFKMFKPCIKRYLNNHVESAFINIRPTEWDMALFLPTERFQKANKQRVWSESVTRLEVGGRVE